MKYQVLTENIDIKCAKALGVTLNRCPNLATYRYIAKFKAAHGRIIEFFVYACDDHMEIKEN